MWSLCEFFCHLEFDHLCSYWWYYLSRGRIDWSYFEMKAKSEKIHFYHSMFILRDTFLPKFAWPTVNPRNPVRTPFLGRSRWTVTHFTVLSTGSCFFLRRMVTTWKLIMLLMRLLIVRKCWVEKYNLIRFTVDRQYGRGFPVLSEVTRRVACTYEGRVCKTSGVPKWAKMMCFQGRYCTGASVVWYN